MTQRREVWAVVPVKRFAAAKTRLAPVLGSQEREVLARLMLEDVLETLSDSADLLAWMMIVTSDRNAAAIAEARGAAVVWQDEDNGINAALRVAIDRIGGSTEAGVVIVPSDIPQLSRRMIAAAVEAIARPRSLAIAAAREDGGTNLIACRPAAALPLHFGPGSFMRHCRAAQQNGLSVSPLHLPELLLDIDRPEDLKSFRALHTQTRTHAFLSEIMHASRTNEPDASIRNALTASP